MTDADLAQLIELGHETRRVEFKGPGQRTDEWTLARIARAVLALSNLRGGGVIILGVAERPDKTLDAVGLDAASEATWADYDTLCGQLASYADPSVTIEVEVRQYMGRRFVAISVDEFAEVPVICKKACARPAEPTAGRPRPDEILRAGAIYVRSRRKPESVSVSSPEDMREVVDLAVEKAVARFRTLSAIAGGHAGARPPSPSAPAATAAYDRELEELP
jgi:predicted HTH transcriptional regulator